jgi:hypothetical protein
MDMHEREVALKLRARLRTLERTHRANVTKALDTAVRPAATKRAVDASMAK